MVKGLSREDYAHYNAISTVHSSTSEPQLLCRIIKTNHILYLITPLTSFVWCDASLPLSLIFLWQARSAIIRKIQFIVDKFRFSFERLSLSTNKLCFCFDFVVVEVFEWKHSFSLLTWNNSLNSALSSEKQNFSIKKVVRYTQFIERTKRFR